MGKRRDRDGRILRGSGKLDLKLLAELTDRPALYEQGDRSFWTDPYVSQHVLDAHLDPHIDDASRTAWQIGGTVEKICAHMGDGIAAPYMLDIACGPGLYAEQFAARGYVVCGIDFAEKSIAHARRSAKRDGLAIEYRQESFMDAALGGPYDLITMIYGEFCTLTEVERTELLARVKEALKPGGLFVFDVFTEHYVNRMRDEGDFYVSTGNGFWHPSPHIVLEQVFRYPAASASVSRYTLVQADGSYRQFSVWWRSFTIKEITTLLEEGGFRVEATYGSLWGDAPQEHDEWIGLYARSAGDPTSP